MKPADASAQFFVHATARNVLRRLVRAFDGAGIAFLPVKGVITAHELYDTPTERPIADIDVRVAPEALGAVRLAALRAGWPVIADAPAYRNLVFEVSGLMVDVEGTVGPPGMCRLRVSKMIERARMLPEGWLTPELHDHALLLVVNAFKDKVVRAPRWSIEDLVRIVRRTSFDLDVFVARTVEARSTTIVWFVANWLACAHADRVWQCVRDRIAKRPRRQVYQHLLASMVARAPEALATRLLARLGSDEPRDWVEALTRLIWWEAQTGRQRRRRR